MLRTLFVLGIVAVGAAWALREPFWALPLYLWVAYFRPESWVWGDFVGDLKLSYVLGLYLVVMVFVARARFRWDGRCALLGVLVGHSLVSSLLSPYADYALSYWRDFAVVALVTYLLFVLTTDLTRYRQVVLTIALSLAFENAKQGWIQLLFSPGRKNYNFHAMLGDENGVAVGMFMLVPVLIALAKTAQGRWERLLHWFLALGIFLRGIETYSRGGFLAGAAVGLVYIMRGRQRLQAVVAVTLGGTLLLAVLPHVFWERMGTIAVSEEERDFSAQGRLHFWEVAVRMAADRPVFGVGHNAYSKAYDAYDFSQGKYGSERAVHGTLFGVLAELGYPGFGLYVAALGLAFAACRRARRLARRANVSALGHYALALEASFAAVLVGGTFVMTQYSEMFWHFVGLSMVLNRLAHEVNTVAHAGSAMTLRPAAPWLALAPSRIPTEIRLST